MKIVVPALLGTLVVLIGVGLVRQAQTNAQLREEIASLRAELQGSSNRPLAGTVPVPAAATHDEALENLRRESRAQIAALRGDLETLQRKATAAREAKGPSEGAEPAPLHLTPVGALKNAGNATPASAMETVAWAATGGDVDALARVIALDDAAQAKAEALFARLPENTRAEYGSPEKLVALFIAKDVAGVNGMQVTGENVGKDQARVTVLFQGAEGKMKEDDFRFRSAADGWKLVIPGKAIDKFDRVLSGKK